MKRIYQYFSLLSFTFSLYFGWLAYHHLAAEDMDRSRRKGICRQGGGFYPVR